MRGRGGEGGSFLPSGAAAGCVQCVLGFDGLRHGLACWMCGSVRLPCSLQAAPWDPPRISGGPSLAGADVRWPGQPLRTGGSCAPARSHQRLFTVSMSTLEGGHAGCKCPPARHAAGVGAGAGAGSSGRCGDGSGESSHGGAVWQACAGAAQAPAAQSPDPLVCDAGDARSAGLVCGSSGGVTHEKPGLGPGRTSAQGGCHL